MTDMKQHMTDILLGNYNETNTWLIFYWETTMKPTHDLYFIGKLQWNQQMTDILSGNYNETNTWQTTSSRHLAIPTSVEQLYKQVPVCHCELVIGQFKSRVIIVSLLLDSLSHVISLLACYWTAQVTWYHCLLVTGQFKSSDIIACLLLDSLSNVLW